MYIIEYINILISAPFLWGISLAAAVLFYICINMLKESAIRLIGAPLIVGSAVASFFPVDTTFCIQRDTISGYCYSELGTGIVILFTFSYCIAQLIFLILRKVKSNNRR